MVAVVECAVTTAGGRGYRSRPAGFGRSLEYGLQYAARLQVVGGDAHLCGEDEDDDGAGEGEGEADDLPGNHGTSDDGGGMIRVVGPADGLPGASASRRRSPPNRRFFSRPLSYNSPSPHLPRPLLQNPPPLPPFLSPAIAPNKRTPATYHPRNYMQTTRTA